MWNANVKNKSCVLGPVGFVLCNSRNDMSSCVLCNHSISSRKWWVCRLCDRGILYVCVGQCNMSVVWHAVGYVGLFSKKGLFRIIWDVCKSLSFILHTLVVKRSLPGNGSLVDIKQMFLFLISILCIHHTCNCVWNLLWVQTAVSSVIYFFNYLFVG